MNMYFFHLPFETKHTVPNTLGFDEVRKVDVITSGFLLTSHIRSYWGLSEYKYLRFLSKTNDKSVLKEYMW